MKSIEYGFITGGLRISKNNCIEKFCTQLKERWEHLYSLRNYSFVSVQKRTCANLLTVKFIEMLEKQ